MDKFPLMQDGRPVGELITEREALYTGESCGWASWSPAGTGPPSGGGFPPN